MTATRLKLAALGLAAAFATTMTFAATSSPAYAAGPAATSVTHADLNLAAAAGERKLRTRVKLAAEALCMPPNPISLKVYSIGRACIADAVEAAEPQVQAAIERRRNAQYAARAAD